MAKVANNVLELIGDTPVIKFSKITGPECATIYGKLENFNPMCSVKDRICLSMIEAAEKEGRIKPGDTLIEPTSGNTGIGLAFIAAYKGYRLVLTMPETMSLERRKILKVFGADIILTEGSKGMTGAVEKAKELAEKNGWNILQQFENPANPAAHRQTTAREILEQVPDLDAFVAGIGTGGTITGVGEVLRQEITDRKVIIVAVEPAESPVLSRGIAGPHKIQGIGAGFIPAVLNTEIYDEVITVKYDQAKEMVHRLAREEGLFLGISAGAALWAALVVGRRLGPGKKVVVILPDHGERYLSTELFEE
ncbi:cysteine synthase A [Candidatus Aminicenantes bacterium AC-334-K16]|jgi:cysteine synthase A|nr:cysteine synthase A [Candidatus Aminicenantes bacterium AC-334-K16]